MELLPDGSLPERPPRCKNRKKKQQHNCNGCASLSGSEDDIYRKSSALPVPGASTALPVDDMVALIPVDCVNGANRVQYYDNQLFQSEMEPEAPDEPELEPETELEPEPEAEAEADGLIFRHSAAAGIDTILTEMEHEILLTGSSSCGIQPAAEYFSGSERGPVASHRSHPVADYFHQDQLIAEMSKLDWDASGATKKAEPKIGGLTIEEFIHFLALLERVKEQHLDPATSKHPLPLSSGSGSIHKMLPGAELGRSSPYDNMASRIRNQSAPLSPVSAGSSSGDSDSGDEYLLPESASASASASATSALASSRSMIPDGVAVLEQLFRRRYLHVIPEEAGSDASSRISRALSDLSAGSEDPASPLPADLTARIASALQDFPRSPSKSGSTSGANSFFPQVLHDLHAKTPDRPKNKPEVSPELKPEARPEVGVDVEPEVTEVDEWLLPVSVLMIQTSATSGLSPQTPEQGQLPEILIQEETASAPCDDSGIVSYLRKDDEKPAEASASPQAESGQDLITFSENAHPPEESARPNLLADANTQTDAVTEAGIADYQPSCSSGQQMDEEAASADGMRNDVIGTGPIQQLEEVQDPEWAADENRTGGPSGTEERPDESRDDDATVTSCGTDTHPASASGIFRAELIVLGSPSLSPEDNFQDNFQDNFENNFQDNLEVDSKVDSEVDSEEQPEGGVENGVQVDLEVDSKVEMPAANDPAANDPAANDPDCGSHWLPDGAEAGMEEMSQPDAVSTPKLKDSDGLAHPAHQVGGMVGRNSPEETGYSTDNGPERPTLPTCSNFRFHPAAARKDFYFHRPIPPPPPPPPPPPQRTALTFLDSADAFRRAEEEEERLKASLLADWLHTGSRKRADLDRSSYSTLSSTTLFSDSRNASAQESESESESIDYWRVVPDFRRVRMSYDRGGYSSGPELSSAYYFQPHPHPHPPLPPWNPHQLEMDHQLNGLFASCADENYGELLIR